MTTATNILLVGSLPPQPSHAALLTQSIAQLLIGSGAKVTCLIDGLAPPPVTGSAYDIIRPFSPDFLAGKYDNWPRLYILGGEGGSLMALKMLHVSPGPVVMAGHSLFPIVPAWLQQTTNPDQSLFDWLTSRFDQNGATLARGIIQHRRNSTAIGDEISCVDWLLAPATEIITVGDPLEPSGPVHPTIILDPSGSPSASSSRVRKTGSAEPGKKLEALVIGLSRQHEVALLQKTNSSAFGANLSVICANRFSGNIHSLMAEADVVAILDGQDTSFCPHAHHAITSGKAVVSAGQKWSGIYPAGSILPIDHPDAMDQLSMALGALAVTDGLLTALWEKGTAPLPACPDRRADWYDALLSAAATATPIHHPGISKLDNLIGKRKKTDQAAPARGMDSIVALAGAIPAKPILENLLPDIRYQSCPRFMTPELASTLSSLMKQPRARLVDDMGFEASLLATARSPENPKPDRKTRSWRDVQRGLRRASSGIAFGCSIEGLSMAPSSSNLLPTRWKFHMPVHEERPSAINRGYDAAAGIYWVYDASRNAASFLLFTGGTGNLELTSSGEITLIVSDRLMTTLAADRKPVTLKIEEHGIAFFELAIAPDETGNSGALMKTLAEQGLHLEWLPL